MTPGSERQDPLLRLANALRSRVVWHTTASEAVRWVALWGFLWGTGVLVFRVGFETPRELLLWGLMGALPALVLAGVRAWRSRPSLASLRALLDRHNAGGGLIMAAGEAEIGGWRPSLGQPEAPRVSSRPPLGLFAGAAGFVAAAFLVPVLPTQVEAQRPLEVGEEIDRLADQIEVLEEEQLLEDETASRWSEELATLRDEALGDEPATTWEALDHLQEMTERTVAEAAEAALAEGEQLAVADAVAEALSEAGSAADPERLAAAMKELSALATKTAAESRWLAPELAADLESASQSGSLGDLSKALKEGRGSLSEKLQRLNAAGMIDLQTLLDAQRSMEQGSESLADFLDENGLEAASGFCESGGAGQGGVTRGRGDAPMTWKDPSASDGAQFRPQVLDAATLQGLHESHLLGLRAADPTTTEDGGARGSTDGALDAATGGGGAAHTQTLLPRHRGAVRRYFDRSAPADDPPQ